MSWLRSWFSRVKGLFNKGQAERELTEEMAANLDFHIEDNIRAGMTPGEARRVALIKFGNLDAAKEAWRDRRGIPLVETVLRDARYAVRMLYQNKGWTAVAVLSLALGIGVNTALFSVVHNVALKALTVSNPEELVALRWVSRGKLSVSMMYGYGHIATADDQNAAGAAFSHGVFEELRTANQTLTDVFAFAPFYPDSVMVRGESDLASAEFVSGNLYQTLGVTASRGRMIEPADDAPDAEPVAVISHQYWRRRFGMGSDTVGSTIRVNDVVLTVVGIKPAELGELSRIGNEPPDLSIPLQLEPQIQGDKSALHQPAAWWLMLMGRRRDGATLQQVQDNLQTVYEQAVQEEANAYLNNNFPENSRNRVEPTTAPRLQVMQGSRGVFDLSPQFSGPLPIFGVVFGIVLLTACVNVVNLLLARSATRQREIAVRMAIGATRRRVARQLLTESMLIALLGGAVGLVVAYATSAFFPASMAPHAVLDWRAFGFAAATALAGGILFGLAPAWRASGADYGAAMRESATHISHSRSRLAKSLVAFQVAMSLVLLMGAGLFLRTLENLKSVPVGFNANNLLTFRLSAESVQRGFYEGIVDRLRAVPGVQAVTFSDGAHASAALGTYFFDIFGKGATHIGEGVHQFVVHHNFFDTMEIPVKLGRGFTSDDARGPKVVVVNESFARAFFPNTNPIGGYVNASENAQGITEIVGVVGDTKESRVRVASAPTVYLPASQRGTWPGELFVVRTLGEPEKMIRPIRDAITKIDPALPISNISTQMTTIAEKNWSEERTFALVSTFFGALTLLISMIGLFGLMLYNVARRSKEIGIRIALGAQRWEILYSVIRETLVLVVIGLALGLGAAFALTRYIESLLFGVTSHDSATIVGSLALIIIVATLAACVPARRAAHMDPLIALRHD